jgi:hypothetical protein
VGESGGESVCSTENSFRARFLPGRGIIRECHVRGPYGSVTELVVTGVAFAGDEVLIEVEDGETEGGAE